AGRMAVAPHPSALERIASPKWDTKLRLPLLREIRGGRNFEVMTEGRVWAGVLAAVLVAVSPVPPNAEAAKDDLREIKARAKDLVVKGTEAFAAERFQEAAERFLEAYELLATRGLSVKPELLHN